MKRLMKYKVGFWMSSGNKYIWFIKATCHQEAVNKGYKKLCKYEINVTEPLSDINEIMVHCLSKEV